MGDRLVYDPDADPWSPENVDVLFYAARGAAGDANEEVRMAEAYAGYVKKVAVKAENAAAKAAREAKDAERAAEAAKKQGLGEWDSHLEYLKELGLLNRAREVLEFFNKLRIAYLVNQCDRMQKVALDKFEVAAFKAGVAKTAEAAAAKCADFARPLNVERQRWLNFDDEYNLAMYGCPDRVEELYRDFKNKSPTWVPYWSRDTQ